MSTRPLYDGQAVDPARAAALDHLYVDIQAAIDDGQTIPCIDDPDPNLWVSEDRTDQLEAADRCADCPLMLACRAYVLEFPEHTVMGGELPTPIQKVRSK